jgi:hypothetical protein
MTRKHHLWKEAEDQLLRDMVAAGKSPLLIAARLKRPISGVRRRAQKLGVRLGTLAELRASSSAKSSLGSYVQS